MILDGYAALSVLSIENHLKPGLKTSASTSLRLVKDFIKVRTLPRARLKILTRPKRIVFLLKSNLSRASIIRYAAIPATIGYQSAGKAK